MATAEATQPAIVWFGRDLRLADHPALHAAARSGRPLICIYIKEAFQSVSLLPGGASNWWLHQSLKAHRAELAKLGAELHLLSGEASVLVPHLVRKFNVAELFWNQTEIPWIDQRDRHLAHRLIEMGCQPRVFRSTTLTELNSVKNKQGAPFKVFSAFWRTAQTTLDHERPLPAPTSLNPHSEQPDGEDLQSWNLCPTAPDWAGGLARTWTPGERHARAQLQRFLENGLSTYPEDRDRPDLDNTSRLSPYLAHGEISARSVWHACQRVETEGVSIRAVEKFQAELGWRDFAYYLFRHFGDLRSESFNSKFDQFPWRDDPEAFQAWTRGKTGFPMVDAGMRQLWQTGWMHNRVRMVTASFLVKHLGIHWQQGMRWFEDTLVDADPVVNAASWQWVAGSGADAAPYFRIFNPVSQAGKFDPKGGYVRRYIPEYAQGFGAYPEEIIDLKARREWALNAFRNLPG